MNWTIKRKVQMLLWGSLAGIIILSLFIVIATFSQRSVNNHFNRLEATILAAKNLSETMTQAHEYYQVYKYAPSSAGETAVKSDIALLQKELNQLEAGSNQIDPNELTVLKASINSYKNGFDNFVNINKMVGYDNNSGSRGEVTKSQAALQKLMENSKNLPVLLEYGRFQNTVTAVIKNPSDTNYTAFSNEALNLDNIVSQNLDTKTQSDYNSIMLNYKSAIQSLSGNTNLSNFLMTKFNSNANEVQKAVTNTVNNLNQKRIGLLNQQTIIQSIINVLMVLLSLSTIIALLLFGNRLIRSISQSIDVLKQGAEHLGAGQLRYRVSLIGNDELTDLARSFNQMAEHMEVTLKQVMEATDTLSSSSQNLAAISQETTAQSIEVNEAIQQVAIGAQTQAEHLEDGMALIQSVTKAISDTAELSDQIDSQSHLAQEVSQHGLTVISGLEKTSDQFLEITKLLVTDIQAVAKQSEEITAILKIIQDISKNTDLLALNAAIESARAGEAGRGFAVVSQEIRKLAERSKKETATIQNVIKAITKRLMDLSQETTKLNQFSSEQEQSVKETRHAFSGIAENVTAITDKVVVIQDAVTNVTRTTKDLTKKLEEISAISEETAASTQQVSASSVAQTQAIEQVNEAAVGLQDIALLLEKEVDKFDLVTQDFEAPLESSEPESDDEAIQDESHRLAYDEAAVSQDQEAESEQEDMTKERSDL